MALLITLEFFYYFYTPPPALGDPPSQSQILALSAILSIAVPALANLIKRIITTPLCKLLKIGAIAISIILITFIYRNTSDYSPVLAILDQADGAPDKTTPYGFLIFNYRPDSKDHKDLAICRSISAFLLGSENRTDKTSIVTYWPTWNNPSIEPSDCPTMLNAYDQSMADGIIRAHPRLRGWQVFLLAKDKWSVRDGTLSVCLDISNHKTVQELNNLALQWQVLMRAGPEAWKVNNVADRVHYTLARLLRNTTHIDCD